MSVKAAASEIPARDGYQEECATSRGDFIPGASLTVPPPSIEALTAEHDRVLAANPAATEFTVEGGRYKKTVMPADPALAWDVFVGELGDLVVDKRDGRGLVRPTQSASEPYAVIAIRRAVPGPSDVYFRRRLHQWVANSYHGPKPSPDAIVEHLDDDPLRCEAQNLKWSNTAANRARKALNDRNPVPEGRIRRHRSLCVCSERRSE